MIDKTVVDELIDNINVEKLEVPLDLSNLPAQLDASLRYFLSLCNGGYSNDNYFHFFGTAGPATRDINVWNSPSVWKQFFDDEILAYFFFAEDIFGNQFGFRTGDTSGAIYMFRVDDGRLEIFADDFEQFVDYTVFGTEIFQTMRDLSSDYFAASGETFTPGRHLSYKTPILLGGDAGDVNNLELCDAVTDLRLLGQIVTQCRALPLGTRITDVLIDKDSQTVTLLSG